MQRKIWIEFILKKNFVESCGKELLLLLVLSDYLSDHSAIKKKELTQIIQKHKVSDVEFIEGKSDVYHRQQLKKAISDNENSKSNIFEGVCLNREKSRQHDGGMDCTNKGK